MFLEIKQYGITSDETCLRNIWITSFTSFWMHKIIIMKVNFTNPGFCSLATTPPLQISQHLCVVKLGKKFQIMLYVCKP